MLRFPVFLCIFQALAEVATMVAQVLYKQAGGADAQLVNIKADPKIVRLLDFILGVIKYVSSYTAT